MIKLPTKQARAVAKLVKGVEDIYVPDARVEVLGWGRAMELPGRGWHLVATDQITLVALPLLDTRGLVPGETYRVDHSSAVAAKGFTTLQVARIDPADYPFPAVEGAMDKANNAPEGIRALVGASALAGALACLPDDGSVRFYNVDHRHPIVLKSTGPRGGVAFVSPSGV